MESEAQTAAVQLKNKHLYIYIYNVRAAVTLDYYSAVVATRERESKIGKSEE